MDCQIQRIDAKIDAGEKRIAWMGEKLNQNLNLCNIFSKTD